MKKIFLLMLVAIVIFSCSCSSKPENPNNINPDILLQPTENDFAEITFPTNENGLIEESFLENIMSDFGGRFGIYDANIENLSSPPSL